MESLRPTYRLSIGIPGKSNAFEISRKLGLPEGLIDSAKELLSKEDVRFEDVIANAEYHRQIAERERQMAEELGRETVKLRNEAERIRREIEQSKDKSVAKAKAEARHILENARREADSIIGDLKAMKKHTQAQLPEHELQKLKKRLDDGIDSVSEGLGKPETDFTPPKTVKPGDDVEIVHLKTKAVVLSQPDGKGEVQVQAGIMKMKIPLSQLRLLQKEKPKASKVSRSGVGNATVPMEVDVRGHNLEEAIEAVDTYLAGAVLAGLREVSIIHGKGTGVLRSGIQRHLKKHINVKSFRDGMYGEGEQGVTVVTLK